ncbi:MAG: carbon monoxide dehydrogenase subunit G [Proteobacteria bacterium]|nr:carbon monoxide dehydrogenase subunit G [Pseudomonadota bacterium]
MELKGEFRIPASRAVVWAGLNDLDVLKKCIPGCQEIEKTSDTEFTAKVVLKVGPVKAPFKGKVTLSDLDPPNGYKIVGEGQGAAAGFARGEATIRLAEDGGATVLSYEAHATVGGKLAQVGQRLLDATAHKLAGEFFGKFSEVVAAPAEEAAREVAAAAEEAAEPAPGGISPWLWVAGVLAVVAALLLIFGP